MDIEQALTLKRDMDETIGEAVRKFEDATRLRVDDVCIRRSDTRSEEWVYAKSLVCLEAP